MLNAFRFKRFELKCIFQSVSSRCDVETKVSAYQDEPLDMFKLLGLLRTPPNKKGM